MQTSGGRRDGGDWESDSETEGASDLTRRPYLWTDNEPPAVPKELPETVASSVEADDE